MPRPRYELAVFINADDGVWVRPATAVAGGVAFRLSVSTAFRPKDTCLVTQDGDGTRCTCTGRAPCQHVRALRAFGLIR